MILIVGEICVDFTLATDRSPVKMRLGGIVHAARGLWACGIKYSVAAVCPEYLVDEAESYLADHGCHEFIRLGDVVGAPNVIAIGDVREIGHQGYEDILRERKKVQLFDIKAQADQYNDVVIFPGAFDLTAVLDAIHPTSKVTIDIAYDIASLEKMNALAGRVTRIVISTSSELFASVASDDLSPLLAASKSLGAEHLLLKENRGGSRLFDLVADTVTELPAVLGNTVNSVGVGDVYTAVFAAVSHQNTVDAAWRGMQVATRYAQTTFPDDLRRDVQRELMLSTDEVRALGGTILPWHERSQFEIYLAAPDFSYIEKPEIEAALSSLQYHNFVVRRPVQENGEADQHTPSHTLQSFYRNDVELLNNCSLVFAIPLLRDPGTLVEIGMAIALGKPVVTFDPRKENNNTMVICGSNTYSADLDECLNALFQCLSSVRNRRS